MADNVLTGATNHFNFPELPNSRIILSEEVYARLAGVINLCAFSGSKELEYGTILYGKEIQPNIIYFDIPSLHDDYVPAKRVFDVNVNENGETSKMLNELINNINNKKYDCIAHIHTPPYIGGTCRFFSNQDLMMIKTLQDEFQPSNGVKKYFFGGLLTVGPENNFETDEISFVFWDEKNGWYKITNITAYLNGAEVPLKINEGRSKIML